MQRFISYCRQWPEHRHPIWMAISTIAVAAIAIVAILWRTDAAVILYKAF